MTDDPDDQGVPGYLTEGISSISLVDDGAVALLRFETAEGPFGAGVPVAKILPMIETLAAASGAVAPTLSGAVSTPFIAATSWRVDRSEEGDDAVVLTFGPALGGALPFRLSRQHSLALHEALTAHLFGAAPSDGKLQS